MDMETMHESEEHQAEIQASIDDGEADVQSGHEDGRLAMAEETRYDGYAITVYEMTGNLLAGDTTGLDTGATPVRYCTLLRERLAARFVAAKITVNLQNASGVCHEPTVYTPDGDIDEAAILAIGSIEEALFSSDEWYVRDSVELYENNAGRLTLVHRDDAWTGLELTGSGFAEDAQAILDDLADDWTVDKFNISELGHASNHPKTRLVAVFDGQVQVVAHLGRAAEIYIGSQD